MSYQGALPTDKKLLLQTALDLVEACRASAGLRAAYCRQINSVIETGRQDGARSLINKLYRHVDRLAAHLFSPNDLRFAVDFEGDYPQEKIMQGKVAARALTRLWEHNNIDMVFAQGVFEALKYGACFLKQWVQQEGEDRLPTYYASLVMPWQFGVYAENNNDLSRQPAICETSLMNLPEVWRRIYMFPDAEKLYARIRTHAQKDHGSEEYNNFYHQVLSSSTLNTSGTSPVTPRPGGIVQLNTDPNYAVLSPQIAIDQVMFHELWVWDETDYTTIQIIEPDILIAPRYKRSNLLMGTCDSGIHPYTLIQPNRVQNYLFGRSEVTDLIEPQGLLSESANDMRRLFGLQVDKILAFQGYDGITPDMYDQFRNAGFIGTPPGSTVSDLTPKFPPETIPLIQFLMRIIDNLGGFDNILSGSGEPGVRAGVHADTLMKTAAPQLRDRSLLVERQCASAADITLSVMEAKDARNYWTDPEKIEETSFQLSVLPEDRRVTVDSHSSSPIFSDNHESLIGFGVKAGFIDGESAIESLPYNNKDILIQRLREKEKKQAELFKAHPELLEDAFKHKGHH